MSRYKSKYEAAARALFETARPLAPWDSMSQSVKAMFHNYAKAAIVAHQKAQREPKPAK